MSAISRALAVAVGVALASVPLAKIDDTFDFKRTYKLGDIALYTQEIDYKGSTTPPITSDLQAVVKSLLPDGAVLDLKVTINLKGFGDSTTQTLTSKVGVSGFPDGGGLNDAGQPFIFMGMAAATTGGKVKVGDDLKVHWQNDKKDTTIDETGTVLSADKDAKTVTVQWNATMTVTYAVGATVKFKSVYSTEDFSLVSSQGTMSVQGNDMTLKFIRKTKA